jgi:hypothetical protein
MCGEEKLCAMGIDLWILEHGNQLTNQQGMKTPVKLIDNKNASIPEDVEERSC